jgi:hypothetical protein
MPIRKSSDAIKFQSMRSGELEKPENIFQALAWPRCASRIGAARHRIAAPIRILIAP